MKGYISKIICMIYDANYRLFYKTRAFSAGLLTLKKSIWLNKKAPPLVASMHNVMKKTWLFRQFIFLHNLFVIAKQWNDREEQDT